jgi:uncharacterized membrane protein (DUF485 family)
LIECQKMHQTCQLTLHFTELIKKKKLLFLFHQLLFNSSHLTEAVTGLIAFNRCFLIQVSVQNVAHAIEVKFGVVFIGFGDKDLFGCTVRVLVSVGEEEKWIFNWHWFVDLHSNSGTIVCGVIVLQVSINKAERVRIASSSESVGDIDTWRDGR